MKTKDNTYEGKEKKNTDPELGVEMKNTHPVLGVESLPSEEVQHLLRLRIWNISTEMSIFNWLTYVVVAAIDVKVLS